MFNKNFFSSCNKGKGLLIMKFLLKYKRIKDHDWQEENQSWLFTRVAKIWICNDLEANPATLWWLEHDSNPHHFPFWCTDHSPHCLYMTSIVKYDLLKFTNSWPGHCNSAWRQFNYRPITVPLPKRDRPQHHGDFPLLFMNNEWNLLCARVVRQGPRFSCPHSRRLESLTVYG